MAYTFPQTQPLTVEDFLAQYGENPRYELADGEIIDLEPTGPHEDETLLASEPLWQREPVITLGRSLDV